MSTLEERINAAVRRAIDHGWLPARGSSAALARACNVAAPSVSDWLRGKTKTIKAEYLLAASRALRVRPEWLDQGVGPMALDAAEPTAAPLQITAEDALDHLGMLVAAMGPDMREVMATNLAGWARAGGAGGFRNAVLNALQGEANKRRAA